MDSYVLTRIREGFHGKNQTSDLPDGYDYRRMNMQILDLHKLIEFNDQRANPKMLVGEPGQRIVLLCLRAGQSLPEHSNQGIVTVQNITGHATFYDGGEPCEMFPGMLVRLAAGRAHRVEAHQDTALLVTITRRLLPAAESKIKAQKATHELDLRPRPRPERHPLVFAAFDRLNVGESFALVNDHDPIHCGLQIERKRPGEWGGSTSSESRKSSRPGDACRRAGRSDAGLVWSGGGGGGGGRRVCIIA